LISFNCIGNYFEDLPFLPKCLSSLKCNENYLPYFDLPSFSKFQKFRTFWFSAKLRYKLISKLHSKK
jgi:hypothetical protein